MKRITITESQLRNIISEEHNNQLLTEAQTKIDNFDMIADKIMDDNDDNVYPVQIIRRWKDNPTDFAGKAEGKRNGTYNSGAWYLKHWLIRNAEDLYAHRDEIIKCCEDNNARAYIMINPRSYKDTTNYINSQKMKYGRHYRPVEEIKAWFASKTGDNWKDQRPRLFLDIDTPEKYVWDTVHKMIEDFGVTVVTEYKTPSGGLHIVLADKNEAGLVELKKHLSMFDSGKNLNRNATVHPNEDGKLILYSNVQTPGYINEEHDPEDDIDHLESVSKIRLLINANTMQIEDIDCGNVVRNVEDGYVAVYIETRHFRGGEYECGGDGIESEPYCHYDSGEWGGKYKVVDGDGEVELDDATLEEIIENNYDDIKEAFEECAEPII